MNELVETQKQRIKRLNELKDSPMTIEIICDNVAAGGSLPGLCKTWDVPFNKMLSWIREDRKRNDLYVRAIDDRNEWTRELVLRELRNIGDVDLRKLYDKSGNLLPVHEWPEEIARSVSGLDVEELKSKGELLSVVKKVKLFDKLRALELLGKNTALFVERNNTVNIIRLEDLLAESYNVVPAEGVKDVTPESEGSGESTEGDSGVDGQITSEDDDGQLRTDPELQPEYELPTNLPPELPADLRARDEIPNPFAEEDEQRTTD